MQHSSLNFDAATFEIVMALGTGATLCLLPSERWLPDAEFVRILRQMRITVVTITPSALAALPPDDLPDLRTIFVAGEACSAELVARWGRGRRMFNLYGPTETTIWATAGACHADGLPPTIGRPIANTQLYVLDGNDQPTPIGVPGELCIGGVGLARGYLHRSALTATKFIPNPFGLGRLYRTGDRVRYRPDGNLEFLGRTDDQVKMRGFRIELGEIEHALLAHPQVQDCTVIVREDRPGDKQLVAYLVPESASYKIEAGADNGASVEWNVRAETFRAYLNAKLPPHMVPAHFVSLDALPLTPHGKVDRRALPTPRRPIADSTIPALRSPTEQQLTGLWADILGVHPIGCHDNFFNLGGHSLRAVTLIKRVQDAFGVTLSVRHLYSSPTISAMAQTIRDLTPSLPKKNLSQQSRLLPPCLVPLQSGGSQPPFFCVHPVAGVVFPYYDLAMALGEDQPVYGLQAVGLDASEQPLTCIKAMAERYVAAIRTVQPHGPYLLGAWSFGVHVAYEMAQQLHWVGEPLALLALIDTPPASALGLGDMVRFSITTAAPSIWPYVIEYFRLSPRRPSAPASEANGHRLGTGSLPHRWQDIVNARGAWLSAWRQLPEAMRVLRVMQANLQAQVNYTPLLYPGRLVLLRTGQALGASGRHPDLGWRQLAQGGVDIYRVPGHHLNLLRQPNVQVLAGHLRHCLRTAAHGQASSATDEGEVTSI